MAEKELKLSSIIIGLDIGGSTTKIVGMKDGKLFSPLQVKAGDPLTSAYGAFGRFLEENRLTIADISKVMCTGVGSSFIEGSIFGVPTHKVDEFVCVGLGGRELSGKTDAIIVSLGTGTAFVGIKDGSIRHLGGTGVGGGTVTGLADKMVGVHSFSHLEELAKSGLLSNVDLSIGDISRTNVSNMNVDVTASNFGKISDKATQNDIALGIFNLVYQTVGMLAVFAARSEGVKDIVLTGNLTSADCASSIFSAFESLFDIKMLIPERADFATSIGAAIYGSNN